MMKSSSTPVNDDEISIATVAADNCSTTTRTETKEYVVKFLFRPSNDNTNAHVAKTHYTILRAISQIYSDTPLTIFDNFGRTMASFPALKSYDAYMRHFKLHYVKGNETKRRKPIYLVYHRIHSSVPLSEIRRNEVIFTLLRKVNTIMTTHMWKEDETHISNLGFHVGVDPSNFIKEYFEERIRNQISQATKRSKDKIPRFQCCYSSPRTIDDYGDRISTKTYDLQCNQKDAKLLINLLKQTYTTNPSFIFHRLRHDDNETYKNAIQKQNHYLAHTRTIPITGLSEDQMFYIGNEIEQLPGVNAVLHHRYTHQQGRWNILTTVSHFKTVTAALRNMLPIWVDQFSDCAPSDPSLPAVGLAFKSAQTDEDSGISFQSYLSSCSSIYTTSYDSYNYPPESGFPTPQAWGNTSVPTFIENTPSPPTSNHDPPQDLITAIQQQNQQLKNEVAALTETVQNLLRDQSKLSTPSPTSPSRPHLHEIVAAVVAALESKIPQLNLSPAPTTQKRKSMTAVDTSMDSLMDDHDV